MLCLLFNTFRVVSKYTECKERVILPSHAQTHISMYHQMISFYFLIFSIATVSEMRGRIQHIKWSSNFKLFGMLQAGTIFILELPVKNVFLSFFLFLFLSLFFTVVAFVMQTLTELLGIFHCLFLYIKSAQTVIRQQHNL